MQKRVAEELLQTSLSKKNRRSRAPLKKKISGTAHAAGGGDVRRGGGCGAPPPLRGRIFNAAVLVRARRFGVPHGVSTNAPGPASKKKISAPPYSWGRGCSKGRGLRGPSLPFEAESVRQRRCTNPLRLKKFRHRPCSRGEGMFEGEGASGPLLPFEAESVRPSGLFNAALCW